MAAKEAKTTSNWKHPDELLKIHRLKLRQKQLAARLNQNNNATSDIDTDKTSLLEAKIAQKRKNPFAKTNAETNKRPKNDVEAEPDEDSSLLERLGAGIATTVPDVNVFVRETPTKPAPAKLVLKPFDAKAFAKLLHTTHGVDDEVDENLEEQKFSKHLPLDWTLKSRVRFFCVSDLPDTTLKTNQMASALTSFVRCIDTLNSSTGLDISPASRFNQATYYWQHPHIPWMKLFPRNAKENNGITMGDRERKALAEEWDYSFRGLFQLLRARQCPYFYLCANTFTVLFRAAGTAGLAEIHALMTPSTHGMRSALRQEGIEYTMPLKKCDLNKSGENSLSDESNSMTSIATEKDANISAENNADDDEADEDAWLESLEVDDKEMRRIKTAHQRKIKAREMSTDFSDNSLLLIEGVECQGFFSFLLNAKSTISSVGRLAGVPPTLLAPVAFPRATMQHLNVRNSKVRMDGVDYSSIELKGIILPTLLPYVCQLLGESKKTYSATLASFNNTLAFSKATQKLLDGAEESTKREKQATEEDETDIDGGEVFGQENLSDCGLLPCVVKSLCATGTNAVVLLERVCFDSEHGFAWS